MDPVDPLWGMYIAEILKHATQGDFDPSTSVFSPASIATSIALGDLDSQVINWTSYLLGDTIPVLSGTYAPAGGLFISNWLFLSCAAAPDMSFEASSPIAAYHEELRRLAEQQLQILQQYALGHAHSAGMLRATPAAAPVAALPATNGDLAALHQQVVARLAQGQSPDAALTATLDACFWASRQMPNSRNMPVLLSPGSATAYCPLYQLRDFSSAFTQWQAIADAQQVALRITLPPQTGSTPPSLHTPLGSLGAGLDASQFLQLAATSTTAALYTGDLESLTVEFAGFGAFDLDQGDWFNLALLQKLRSRSPGNTSRCDDERGALNLLPQKVILGFRPRLSLQAASETAATSLAEQLTSIGPFPIAAAAGNGLLGPALQTSTTVVFDDHASSIPVLLGVISQRLDRPAGSGA